MQCGAVAAVACAMFHVQLCPPHLTVIYLHGDHGGSASALARPILEKYMDAELEEEYGRGSEPFDITRITSFASILLKASRKSEQQRMDQDKELASRVAQANLDQLIAHRAHDEETVDQWRKERATAIFNFQQEQIRYKNQRYEKGLVAVSKRMEERLHLEQVKSVGEALQVMSSMRVKLSKIRFGPSNELCRL